MKIRSSTQSVLIKFLLFFIILFPPYITIKSGGLPGINPERLLMLYTFILWLFFYFYSYELRQKLLKIVSQYKNIFFVLTAFYFISLSSSVLNSVDTLHDVANFFIKFLGQVFLLIFVISFVKKEQVVPIIKFILILELGVLMLSVVESTLQHSLFSMFSHLNENVDERFIVGDFRDDKYRVISTMPHSLVLTLFLLILLPFNHFFLKYSVYKIIFLLNILFTPIVIVLTDSRMGMAVYIFYYLILIIRRIYTLIFTKRARKFIVKILFISVLIVIIITIGLLVTYFDTFIATVTQIILENSKSQSVSAQNSSIARLLQMVIVQENITWFGYGAKGVQVILENYRMESMDNYYLTIILRVGIIGLITFGILSYMIFNLIIRNISENKIILPFFYFFLLYYLFVLILSIDYLMSLFYVFLGFLFIILKKDRVQNENF